MEMEICYNSFAGINQLKCKKILNTTTGVSYVKINLRKLRIESGLTIEQLSDRSHVGVGTISRIENYETNPKITTLCKLCSALKVSMDKMVECEGRYYDDEW